MKRQETAPERQERIGRVAATFDKMLKSSERLHREATAFKLGDLTPEEEEFVKENNLNALTYIPLKIRAMHEEAHAAFEERQRIRAEIMSRAPTDPERMRLVQEEAIQRWRKEFTDRFDGFGYGMILLVIAGVSWLIADAHGWPIGIFAFVLMVAVIELSYRLTQR